MADSKHEVSPAEGQPLTPTEAVAKFFPELGPDTQPTAAQVEAVLTPSDELRAADLIKEAMASAFATWVACRRHANGNR